MRAGRFIPGPFRGKVSQKGGGLLPHPEPRVVTRHPVLAVREGRLGGVRRSGRGSGRHGGQGTPTRLAAAGALLAAVLLPGLAMQPAAQAADGDVTFTVGLLNEVDSFNPFRGIEAEAFEMWALTYDYMITYNMEDISPEPGLATTWETTDDGLSWTFDIREGVTWSDGEPLTAADIAYTYNRVMSGNIEGATWSSYLNGVDTVEAPDATHVVLTMKRPNAVLPLLPIPIVPEHIWKDVDSKEVKSYAAAPSDGQSVVGSGPFRLIEGEAGGSTYRFEANPDYWQGAPHIDKLVFRVYKSEDPAVQALIKGEIDFVEDITALQVDSLKDEETITAQMGDTGGFNEIAFNTGAVSLKTGDEIGDGNPALKDPKFRHALGYALDLDQIISKVYQGAGDPGTTIVPPAYEGFHWEPPEDVKFTFDLDKAGELLDEAGYEVGDDGLRTMPDGSPLGTLRLAARTDSSGNVSLRTMDFFQEWLSEIGIKAEVETYESSKLTDVILEGTFDAFEWGWYVEPDPDSMLSYMTCDQRENWSDSWYCNADYDALYEAQNQEMDLPTRQDMVKQMQEMLYTDSPYLVTAYWSTGEAVRSDRFACLQPQPDPGGIWLIQYGIHNYLSVRPAEDAGDCDGVASASRPTLAAAGADESDGSNGLWLGAAGAAVVVVLLAGGIALRRRGSAGDRE
ncbi:putative Extracellular solute-binding protein family 5 [metagenome]|uniref:Putative Extracellular solute-binding protein family 5 n=1 Tax=metagenome TaxID=256318 RepID=A0A2P2CE50_9ZZZZ